MTGDDSMLPHRKWKFIIGKSNHQVCHEISFSMFLSHLCIGKGITEEDVLAVYELFIDNASSI